MEKDTLRDNLTSIENWCKTNDIAIFNGVIDDNAATEVSWTITSDNDWEKYLAAAKKIGASIIIIDYTVNDIDVTDQAIVEHIGTLEDEVLEEYKESLKKIIAKPGHVVCFDLYFLRDNVSYKYSHLGDWLHDYYIVNDAFIGAEEDEDENENSQPVSLSEEAIEVLARKITSNEKYLTATTPTNRHEILNNLLKQEIGEDRLTSQYRVKRRCDSIYELEIKPRQEEEMKDKVLELKLKGLKKVMIASKLGISERTVNKYFHADI